jgi:hypothetical protein
MGEIRVSFKGVFASLTPREGGVGAVGGLERSRGVRTRRIEGGANRWIFGGRLRASPKDTLFSTLYMTLYLPLHKYYILYIASHSNRLSI